MTRLARALGSTFVVTLLGAGAVIAPAPGASAGAPAAAAAGVCKDASGVTVVVDMSALGGAVVVRCVKGSGFTGLDALKKAGFSVAGTQRFGNAYVCRIQGRPSATEPLAIPGNANYQEKCVNTPPTSAYWGYWYAKNGGNWTYSTSGASGHTVIKGGFEGWAFSLNHGGNPPRPAFTPARPKAPAPPSPTSSQPSDQPTEPDETGSGAGGGNGSAGGSGGNEQGSGAGSPSADAQSGDESAAGKGDKNRDGNEDGKGGGAKPGSSTPTTDIGTGAAGDVEVTGELPADPTATEAEDNGGSATPTLIGLGLLVLLGGGAGITAWRRSHRG